MHPERHALRFATYAGLARCARLPAHLAEGARRGRRGGVRAHARAPRVAATGPRPRERAIATVAVPALMAFTDAAKMAGYAPASPIRRTASSAPSRHRLDRRHLGRRR